MKIQMIVDDEGLVPCYQTSGSAGMDLHAVIPAPSGGFSAIMNTLSRFAGKTSEPSVTIPPGCRCIFDVGVKLGLPEGYVGMVKSRSGLAFRFGVEAYHGVIDSDYHGPVKVLLFNRGSNPVVIKNGDRIAQLVVMKHVQAEVVTVEEFDRETSRGSGGFGSTGR